MSKIAIAEEFIMKIRKMDPKDLNDLVAKEVGNDLAEFFLRYSASLISQDPSRVLENTSALMLLGYMIHGFEKKSPVQNMMFQGYALA